MKSKIQFIDINTNEVVLETEGVTYTDISYAEIENKLHEKCKNTDKNNPKHI